MVESLTHHQRREHQQLQVLQRRKGRWHSAGTCVHVPRQQHQALPALVVAPRLFQIAKQTVQVRRCKASSLLKYVTVPHTVRDGSSQLEADLPAQSFTDVARESPGVRLLRHSSETMAVDLVLISSEGALSAE